MSKKKKRENQRGFWEIESKKFNFRLSIITNMRNVQKNLFHFSYYSLLFVLLFYHLKRYDSVNANTTRWELSKIGKKTFCCFFFVRVLLFSIQTISDKLIATLLDNQQYYINYIRKMEEQKFLSMPCHLTLKMKVLVKSRIYVPKINKIMDDREFFLCS